jgi:hypothetical protein
LVFENWKSECLQMAAYVLGTVFLLQRDSAGSEGPARELSLAWKQRS